MAWSIVGVGTVAETTSTTLTLTEPAGVANGDLLIACISSRTTATTGITNPEWALAGQRNINNVLTTTSAAASACMLYRVRSGTPSLSFTLPAGISVAMGRIIAYRTDTGTPAFDLTITGATAVNTTAVSLTGLTTTSTNELIVSMMAGGQEATWSNFRATTPSTGSGATDTTSAPSTTAWFERADSISTTGAQTSLGIFDAVKATVGATGSTLVTASLGAVQTVVTSAFKAVVAGTADAWNTNDKTSTVTLSVVDKTATTTSASGNGVRSSTVRFNGAAGAFYAELRIDNTIGGTAPSVGLRSTSGIPSTASAPHSSVYVAGNIGNILHNGSLIGSIGSVAFANGDVLCVAWNSGTERIWFRLNGGIWNNDASANPATGTNGMDVSAFEGLYFGLWFSATATSTAVTVRTELAEYTQTVPSGFKSWMGETPSAGYTLPAVAGSYALTGTAATPKLARVLDAATAGSYALTGTAATLTKGAAVIHYNLPAAAGSYALNGATAGLYRGREVLAVAGSYGLSGATTSLEVGREVDAVAGAYALTGTAASLELGKEVPALAGTYAVTGAAATLRYDRKPVAVSGAYALSGTAATLRHAWRTAAVAGSYAITGAAAAFARTWKTTAVAGSYGITGTPANLLTVGARAIIGLPGGYALTGTVASLEVGREVDAVAGAYALTGTAATLTKAAADLPSIWVGLTAGATLGVLGSGGSLPTGWEIFSSNCTVEVVGVGVNDDDVECFDIQVTMPGGEGSGYIDIYFPAGINGISGAAPGETWRSAAYLKFLSYTGSAPTYNSIDIGGIGDDEHWIDTSSDLTAIADSGAFQLSYREEQLTFSAADVTHAAGEIYLEADDTSGPISYTLRLAAKLEKTAHGIIGLPGSYALTGSDALLEKESALAVASLVFDATATKGLGGFGTETFPLTVAAAAGQERLVFLAAVSNNSTADFIDCTIDGQTATRVGTLSVGAGSNPCIVTAYRAPGTASTAIDVVVTIENSAYASYCACYKLSNAGALLATTNVSGGDPTLDADTATGGTTAAALLGYSDVAGPTVSWSGLAEDFDGVSMFGDEVFSGASADNATAATPLAIAADSTVAASVASLVVSFRLAAAATAFDANSIGSASDRTFSLAVAEAEGQERLIVLAAVTNGATADFSAVTVDGEAATRIGSLSQGALDGGGNRAIITAWRAPGTAGTAIDVVVTIDGDVYSSYCACFRLVDAGAAASINVAGNDPVLSIDTTADGTVVAATLGYVGGGLTPNTTWSGLTERFDGVTVFGDEVFSGASSDLGIGTAETPRLIAADFDETLTGSTSSVASIVVAFPYAVAAEAVTYTLAAAAGSYALTGTAATLSKAIASTYTLTAGAGSYGLAGAAAVIGHGLIVEAGSYALTGSSATLIYSGEAVPVTPPGGMPWWGHGGHIPRKQLRKAVKELLEREEKRKKRRKPKEIAREIIAAIEPRGLGVAEKRIVTRLISQALLSELPQMFYSQPLIHDKGELARAILFIIERAMQRILDEEEDEEAALLLLSAA